MRASRSWELRGGSRFLLEPALVTGINRGNRRRDDFRQLIWMQGADAGHDGGQSWLDGLGGAEPLASSGNRSVPAIHTGHRTNDLYAGGESLLDECRSDLFGEGSAVDGSANLYATGHEQLLGAGRS